MYALLCLGMSSMCGKIFTYATCNFGSVPCHSIMTTGTYLQGEINAFNAVMDQPYLDVQFNNHFFKKNTNPTIFSSDATKTLVYNGSTLALIASINGAKATLKMVNDAPRIVSSIAPIGTYICSYTTLYSRLPNPPRMKFV